ncbi:FUSC family protein [Mycolicibacterium sediminis]|uniref:FUSC family protein n=1 Tax=Mycolicibacterium sediminis TaxID=1286180 RepID=UPI0013CFA46C|nr:FUSC family protein [Mycolicibacterium sediminis]
MRTRRGLRAVCSIVLAWATMFAITVSCAVDEPLRITLFAAGAAFEGALLAPDPQPRDRVRTLCWAVVVSAVAVIASVGLSLFATWAPAALLVALMFCSYALRSASSRVASLALMGAITVYVCGAGHITVGRVGWFVLAAAVGFAWLALWEAVILPDVPLTSLRRSVGAFSRRAGETVANVAGVLDAVRAGRAPDVDGMHSSVTLARSCRAAVERQLPGVLLRGAAHGDVERLRVELHSALMALEDMARRSAAPEWARALPDEVARPAITALRRLSRALTEGVGDTSCDAGGQAAAVHSRLDSTVMLNVQVILHDGDIVARSIADMADSTSDLVDVGPDQAVATRIPTAARGGHRRGASPTMTLAVQAVLAAVAAAALALLVGNDQVLVVSWTAFLVIAGSAGLSARRAMVRVPATVAGAVGGVALAASVPNTIGWAVAVVAVGVFFTIVTAPTSYPLMVFWMNIAFVPLFATAGSYLDLVWDKTMAALIGGCVAAVIAFVVMPIRSVLEVRPAVLVYLAALDHVLAEHESGSERDVSAGQAALDVAHGRVVAAAAAAASENNVFARPGTITVLEATCVDAVQDAYLRLAPLLADSVHSLHGRTGEQLAAGLDRLRAAVGTAQAAAEEGAQPYSRTMSSIGRGVESSPLVEALRARLQTLGDVLADRTPAA